MVFNPIYHIKKSWHSLVHHTRKNSHQTFYIKGIMRYLVPRRFNKPRLKRQLALFSRLSFDEKRYVIGRVNYYCKFYDKIFLPVDATTLQQFTYRERTSYVNDYINSAYFFDAYELVRFFPKFLKWAYNPGDVNYLFPVPEITKSRPIAVDDSNRNNILLNLDKVRHFTWLTDPFRWEEKQSLILFRGDIRNKPHRARFLEMWKDHPMCDLAPAGNMPIYDHLKYRYIMAIEGNDVASNLKWVMSSNSVAVMPRPKFETWYMEGKLIPNYHYIEISADYHDLIDRVMYYEAHPDEAKAIIQHAQEWTKQFRQPKRERLISIMVMRKYFMLTGQLDNHSSAHRRKHYIINDFVKLNASQKVNAQGKARTDVVHTLNTMGYRIFNVENWRYTTGQNKSYHHIPVFTKLLASHQVMHHLLKKLKPGDVVFIQDPQLEHMQLLATECLKCGVKVVLQIHDVQSIRYGIETNEVNIINNSSVAIVHTEAMKAKLLQMGVTTEMRVINFFDYYAIDPMSSLEDTLQRKCEVVFAGNLSKSVFLQQLYSYDGNYDVSFKLYGVLGEFDFTSKSNFAYCGIFQPEHTGCIRGGWGLVWDGDSISSCSGGYGEYLRYNSSHKNSLYLACGLPLIVWDEAALADVVRREHIGIAVPDLFDLDKRIAAISDTEYAEMATNARRVGDRLRRGEYLKQSIKDL